MIEGMHDGCMHGIDPKLSTEGMAYIVLMKLADLDAWQFISSPVGMISRKVTYGSAHDH